MWNNLYALFFLEHIRLASMALIVYTGIKDVSILFEKLNGKTGLRKGILLLQDLLWKRNV